MNCTKVLLMVNTLIVGSSCSVTAASHQELCESEDLHTRTHNCTEYMKKIDKMERIIGAKFSESKFGYSTFSEGTCVC